MLFGLFKKELNQINRLNLSTNRPEVIVNKRPTQKTNKHDQGDNLNEQLNDKQEDETKNENNLSAENRCYLVIDQARVSVAEFCVHCLKALTGTLLHFWVIKEPLSDADIEILQDYKEIFKGIEDDVYSALHKYLLSTQLKLRPYGFIMNSALLDNLPSDFWQKNMRKEMRLWLQVIR